MLSGSVSTSGRERFAAGMGFEVAHQCDDTVRFALVARRQRQQRQAHAMADAQSLMGPIMILLIVPYILTPVIGRAPDSAIAVTTSFIPPINSFVMLARLASSSPPPVWQVLLSIVVGLVGACLAVWFAAKVFRIGLLMHGKPPSFATLIKWARMS